MASSCHYKATPQEIYAVHEQGQGNKVGGSPLDGYRRAGIQTAEYQISPAPVLSVIAVEQQRGKADA
ncbi:MAG: hypothetical protein MK319_10600, partial [Pseudomonadales bacterium]|nr:hypothetical protein [Pseudomonadales bacterium]